MDGFLYVAVGDKGIPRGVGKDGTSIQLRGGGVIRIRPDGTGLEVVSTGERNPLSTALTATDEVFTYGNDDDSKKWPNSLTHHIVGGHYGYPYEFLLTPWRALPIVAGQIGGSGAQGLCYNEDGLPPSYRGNLFFCDWGLSTVVRFEVERAGGTFALKRKSALVTKGSLSDFRPFSLAVASDSAGLWLVDWAFTGWLADGPKTGRIYRLTYQGTDAVEPATKPAGPDLDVRLGALDHPALSLRLESQRILARAGSRAVPRLAARLEKPLPLAGRLHALWALDAIGTPDARGAIRGRLADRDAEVRLQAARSAGIRGDREAMASVLELLRDREPAVRREAAITLGKLGGPSASAGLWAALGDRDTFAAWSIRHAIRQLDTWDENVLVSALLDDRRRDDALKLADESWAVPVANALAKVATQAPTSAVRAKVVALLAGLYRRYPPWTGQWFGTNPLAGPLPRKTEDWDRAGMATVLRGLGSALADRDPAVRTQAILGLRAAGTVAAPLLRQRLPAEIDERSATALAEALGTLGDLPSAAPLAAMVQDAKRPESLRTAALDALSSLGGPQALRARLTIVYDPNAPPALVARALPSLGQTGVLPPNDLAGFLENPDPQVRAAALVGLNTKRAVPGEVKQAVAARLDDKSPEVRKAAIAMAGTLKIRDAIPKLLAVANEEALRTDATLALTAMPSAQALPLYLAAIQDHSPDLRQRAETALLAIRNDVRADLEKAARSGRIHGPALLAVERILTRFAPLTDWQVIGPFPRTTAQVFLGESSIDFQRPHTGAEGRTIAWTARSADPATGRVRLDDLKAGAGDRGGFGYDPNSSPELGAFAFAEVSSASDRDALLLIGSSGSITVTVNEQVVHHFVDFAGRPYAPDSDLVRIHLKAGKNRLLVSSRQGIGPWSFSVQVSDASATSFAERRETVSPEKLQSFALAHTGDPRHGEEIFFDPKGIGCIKCHAAGGRGTANIGPDLTGLASKYDKAEIIRSVLDPSDRIATGYQSVVLALRDGKVVTGLVRAETQADVELVDADAKISRIFKTAIGDRRVSEISQMPKGLVDTLSVVEFADLIAYLQTLKSAPETRTARH
jgi:putative heme-binding domain-containing protein